MNQIIPEMLVVEGALNSLLAPPHSQFVNKFQALVTSRFHQQSKTENFTNIKISVAKSDLVNFFRYELNDNASSSSWTNPELAKKVQNDPPLFDLIVEKCIAKAGDM